MRRLILLTFFLVGCSLGPPKSCAESNAEFVTDLQAIMQEWTDASTLAGSTPRMGLAVQIGNLQAVRRKAQALKEPACGEPAKTALIKAMDTTIEGFTMFLGQQTQSSVDEKFRQAAAEFQNATDAIVDMKAVPK